MVDYGLRPNPPYAREKWVLVSFSDLDLAKIIDRGTLLRVGTDMPLLNIIPAFVWTGLLLTGVAAAGFYVFARSRRGAQFWIGGFLALWASLAVCTHFWLVAGDFHWWEIRTWLTPSDNLSAQAVLAGRPESELRVEEVRNLFGAIAVLAGSFVGAIQIGNSLHRTHLQEGERRADERRLDRDSERLAGEREARSADVFSRAVSQLAEPEGERMASRIGAIYSLQALARSELRGEVLSYDLVAGEQRLDKPLVAQIVDTLAAFVRHRSDTLPPEAKDKPTPSDIATAVRVLAEVPAQWRPPFGSDLGVDLRRAYLRKIELPKRADLRRFNLQEAVLANARLEDADMSGVQFARADLNFAEFGAANCSGTDFRAASLNSANLSFAVGLTTEQLALAESLAECLLPDGFVAPPKKTAGSRSTPNFDLDSLLQDYRARGRAGIPIPEAMMCILLSAARADGKVVDQEQAALDAIMRQSKILRKLSPDAVVKMNANVEKHLEQQHALQDACESLPTDMRLPIFAYAIEIVLSDGIWHPAEAEFLTRVVAYMRLDVDEARRMIESMMVKNKY